MSGASKATRRLSEDLEGNEEQGHRDSAKFEPADREQKRDAAGDSGPEKDYDDTKPTRFIAAHPVASGGFSTSSVSEEFVKGLKQIEKLLDASAEQKMQAGNVDKPADNRAPEAARSSGVDKGAKDELNRTLKFQIKSQPGGNRREGDDRCKCTCKTCGQSRCGNEHGAAKKCSGSCPRRHRSASGAGGQRRRRRDEQEGAPAAGGVSHGQPSRSHRHHVHHHRHKRRVRDKEGAHDGGCAHPSAPAAGNRRCCRASAAASDSCCLGKSPRHGTSRERHRSGCAGDKSLRGEHGHSIGVEKSCAKKNRKGGSKSGGVFSRYRSNYCSVDTGQSSSTSSSEDDEPGAARQAGQGRADEVGSNTFTFTQTRELPSPVCTRRGEKRGRSRSNCPTGRCAEGPVESTVEKHVLELNFPPSPLMRSISNLLEQSCRGPAAVEDKTWAAGGEFRDDDGDEDRFVHHMKPGQTCELHGESQVVLVSLPEPHKLTVEHLVRKSDSLIEHDRRHHGGEDRELQQKPARWKCGRSRSRDAVRHQDMQDPPRFRRKHSYVRYTTRRKRGEACRGAQILTTVADPDRDSSPESDSSEDHDDNYFADSKEKGTEEVVVCPATKTVGPRQGHDGGEERPVSNTRRQREIKLTIPKPSAQGCCPAEAEKGRSLQYRSEMHEHSRASVERDGFGGDGSAGASCGDDNKLRIVFTDSRLNTELRCILQDSCSDSRAVADRPRPKRCSSRTAVGRRGSGGSRRAQETTSDDTDFVSVESGRRSDHAPCGCVQASGAGPPPRARRFPDASDIVSSSYYSSTHESSLALDEAAARSGCRLCNAMDVTTVGRSPPGRTGTRHRHTYQHCQRMRNC